MNFRTFLNSAPGALWFSAPPNLLWFLLLARFCRVVSLDGCTFCEAEQGGWFGRVENLGTLESWSQEGSGSITKSRERS